MHPSDRLYLSKFSFNADHDSLFEDDGIQNYDCDREVNPLLDGLDFDETNDYFPDEDLLEGNSNRIFR